MNLEIIDVDPTIGGVLGLLANGLGHPVDQLQVEGILLGHLVLRGQLQTVLVVLRKLNMNAFLFLKEFIAQPFSAIIMLQ